MVLSDNNMCISYYLPKHSKNIDMYNMIFQNLKIEYFTNINFTSQLQLYHKTILKNDGNLQMLIIIKNYNKHNITIFERMVVDRLIGEFISNLKEININIL